MRWQPRWQRLSLAAARCFGYAEGKLILMTALPVHAAHRVNKLQPAYVEGAESESKWTP